MEKIKIMNKLYLLILTGLSITVSIFTGNNDTILFNQKIDMPGLTNYYYLAYKEKHGYTPPNLPIGIEHPYGRKLALENSKDKNIIYRAIQLWKIAKNN